MAEGLLLPGFFCSLCQAFTGTLKEDHQRCRCCGTERPKMSTARESLFHAIEFSVRDETVERLNDRLNGAVTVDTDGAPFYFIYIAGKPVANFKTRAEACDSARAIVDAIRSFNLRSCK